eukprot:CAMPEP_0204109716 /NCGR_PEP_ID=MMETSP0361-20130328/1458_1 /ASSEMBLY_ACC=CAM_ASM_000343 /TAXON_ID=268821 /ORGANISM="Scrippsiella Hangoei, Strain SHTV-5" /LENGTH=1008 /DNA_ID=CAMNT_0051059521 /DNA_START=92 /DNA_END=3115 /DNA_ORIENTATION=+
MAPSLLALPWYGAGDTILTEPLVLCGIGEFSRKEVQNAGNAFWTRYEQPFMKGGKGRHQQDAASPDKDDKVETERERTFREKREKKQRESRGKDGGLLKMSDDLKGKDLYALLEVEAGATCEDIKKSYRKLVLVHHPDKMADPTDEQKAHFLLIQAAFEIVNDPTARRRYESTLDFDDSIPTGFGRGKLAEADFYETFAPVFKRNMRWSARPKVPDLGDDSTPIDAVKAFYDFWYEFESWRDPLAMAEKEEVELHNLEDAECREEKRWMERENGRVAKKLGAEERERMLTLVKVAEKNDPRMIRYKEEVFQQKEAGKNARAAALKAEQDKKDAEAKVRAEKAEVKRKVEEVQRLEDKKRKEEIKNALKVARQRLRSLHKAAENSVRHAVHADQLQGVCLRLDTNELNDFCKVLEAEFEKASSDFSSIIELLHGEIEKCGATPIADPSVDPNGKGSDGTSTASGESEDEAPSESDLSPSKVARELTPEELEQQRLRKISEEVEEKARQERRAEEQRKKKEIQRKAEAEREAARRKQEKKESESAKKDVQKAQKQEEQKAKQAEEQRQKSLKQSEEQRAASLAEESERKRLHEEQLLARAFESDRLQRLAVAESYEEGLLEVAFKSTLLQEGSETPNLALTFALRQIAAGLPPPAANKADAADQARRDVEEFVVDLALGCLSAEGGAGAAPEDARARLGRSLALAVRPPLGMPELTKDVKVAVKKQRQRIRTAALNLLRSLQPADAPVAPPAAAAKVPASETPPKPEAVEAGTELIVAVETTLFESPTSYTDLGVVAQGKVVVATGAPVEAEGFYMVPIKPRGAVELQNVRAVAVPKAKAKSKGQGAVKPQPLKKADEPELEGRLKDFVRLSALGPDCMEEAEDEFLQACYGGFDPIAALAELESSKCKATEGDAPQAVDQKAPAAKAGKKAAKVAQPEEDLDALLQEFGVKTTASKSKNKGKKERTSWRGGTTSASNGAMATMTATTATSTSSPGTRHHGLTNRLMKLA